MLRSILQTLCVPLLAFGLVGCSGVDVQGVVRDRDSQAGLSGATVQIGEATTQTDASGYYKMEVEGDDDDTQRVTVRAPGHQPHSEIVTVPEDPERQVYDFTLTSIEERKAASADVKVDVKTGEPQRGEEQPAGFERREEKTTIERETVPESDDGYEYEYERKVIEEQEPN